jgi:hypothetical protein
MNQPQTSLDINDEPSRDMDPVIEDFNWLRKNVQFDGVDGDLAPAILALAASIGRAAPFSEENAGNFGHELGRALTHEE